MRSYCAVYVDAGYVLASAATRVTGTSLRSGVDVDHAKLIEGLIAQAESTSGLRLLRVCWYDSGARSGGQPDRIQEQIGMLPQVKLRLGRRSAYGEQKGVDVRLGLDLVTHARNRVADLIYLASGDDDLTEAVEEAQGHGIQVVLLAVPDSDDRPHAVSRHLQRAADGIELILPTTIDGTVLPIPADAQVGSDRTELAKTAVVVPSPATLANRRVPRPGDTKESGATAGNGSLVYSSRTGDSLVVDRAPDGNEASEAIADEVCQSVLATWAAHATDEDREGLRQGKPYIPSDIDRALLIDLSARLGVYDIEEPTRFLLRERFWVQVEQFPSMRV